MINQQKIDILQHAETHGLNSVEINYIIMEEGSWVMPDSFRQLGCCLFDEAWESRIKPKPKLRPIRPDELPYVFAVKSRDGRIVGTYMCTVLGVIDIKEWIDLDWIYSTDGITWKPFTVEGQEA